ncbi:VOC family protein [Pseudorhodobacter sp.]|uniref:VOC family protein n=1 Tax=Pseudorhodobacter sp. TaxID=1934400 RepID=UPI00264A26C1|nr:VOC family protein [Pseudorhodobacter sp.]MDN5785829.1 VOC family protein [Pseudorhodobacter sp.]
MAQMIFVNLPVSDLERSKAFYQAIGFSLNLNFADDTSCCVVISEHIFLMILTHPRFESFATLPRADTQKSTAALIALTRDSRAAVDAITEAALAAGGTEPKPFDDHGFMYTRTFQDPDGNVFEPFWMDPSAIPNAGS